jgi:hypothetical protein
VSSSVRLAAFVSWRPIILLALGLVRRIWYVPEFGSGIQRGDFNKIT